jgi:hypothetical protein
MATPFTSFLQQAAKSAVLASAFAISLSAVGQVPAKAPKKARGPFVERSLPGCDEEFSTGVSLKRARLPLNGEELVAVMCRDYDAPTTSYIIDIRTSEGRPWLRASVPTDATAEYFAFQFVDHTGVGVPDLVVPIANPWHPYTPTIMFLLDPIQRKLLKVDSYPGESWPVQTGTVGCIVTFWRFGPKEDIASRYCWRDRKQAWELERSCNSIVEQGCEKALRR